jgi:hypothetical protein
VSEALHVPYQRDNRAWWIITADLRRRHDRFNRESVVVLWRVPDRHIGGDAPPRYAAPSGTPGAVPVIRDAGELGGWLAL